MKLPKGWRHIELREIISELKAGVSVTGEGRPAEAHETGVLKVSAVSGGRFLPHENKAVLPDHLDRIGLRPKKGCVLISRSNSPELVGDSALIRDVPNNLVLPDKLWQVALISEEEACSTWLAQILLLPSVRLEIRNRASGSSQSMKNISKESLLGISVQMPPLSEQRRIAKFLGSWDRAIETQQMLLTGKTTRLRTFRHQLLTGAKRFPEFQKQGVWPRTRLEKAAEEMNVRNKGNVPDHKLFAVTKAEGLVPMKDRVKGISTLRCMVVEQDWYAYNPMRINIGSIARHYAPEPVMVSPDYVVFRAKPAVLLPDYLDHLRRSQLWSDFVSIAGSGSVRVRIYFDALGLLSFPLPTIAEQTRIATFLNACQREIDLLTTQLEVLKQQKRGMMQKLLTGEIRTNS